MPLFKVKDTLNTSLILQYRKIGIYHETGFKCSGQVEFTTTPALQDDGECRKMLTVFVCV